MINNNKIVSNNNNALDNHSRLSMIFKDGQGLNGT